MSLRPKRVDFNAVFPAFRDELCHMFAFTNASSKMSGIDMFQTVYDLCTAHPKPHSELLFQSIGEFMAQHAALTLEYIVLQDDLVTAYATAWEQYRIASGYLDVICEYLNRSILKLKLPYSVAATRRILSGPGRFPSMSIEALAYHIWKDRVLLVLHKYHGNGLVYQLLDAIRRDRDGETVAYAHVSQAIASLVRLNQHTSKPLQLYIEIFERPYLEETRQYYAAESSALITQNDVSSYMVKIDQRLSQEVVRNTRMCDSTSLDKVVRQCEHEFITVHLQEIVAELRPMLEQEKIQDCRIAYSLLMRVEGGIAALLEIFQNFVAAKGKDIIARLGGGGGGGAGGSSNTTSSANQKDPREYAEGLIALHAQYMDYCREVLSGDVAFTAAVDHAFRSVINDQALTPGTNSAEILARFCDSLLKKSAKGLAEAEVETKLGQMVTLFKYVEDKDVFQKFYARMLAKRLIHGTSVSDDAEMGMISRLKMACGVEYTTKLQRMFTDTTLSSELNAAFGRHCAAESAAAGKPATVEMNVMVLTAGSWPLVGIVGSDFALPTELEQNVMSFTSYYAKQYSGRKLTWMHHLAKADVRVAGMDKRYELSLSLHQTAVLMLFNNARTSGGEGVAAVAAAGAAAAKGLSVADLCAGTRLAEGDVLRILKIFLDLKLLIHDAAANTYAVNPRFTNKRTKIKVSTALQADTPAEIAATRTAIDDDRRLYLQAAIVRIMKARQSLAHAQLVGEVLELAAASRFRPSVALIKKCVEGLIDKQYLERVPGARDRYVYIS
ncbi:Cullin-2 [Geranomyces variabilis]|nr:Cullin-2 [Geranomyces variabilis]